jgi:4-hydroxy-2-oxoheptanedioate aldolase
MKQRINKIRQRLANGDVALGATVQTASPEAVEMVGMAGYDFVWIDAEHGTIDLGTLVHMIRAADAMDLTSIVRVPDHSPSFITRTLDAGALGILAPHVRSKEEAQALVRAVKYGPRGERGACPSTRATGHLAANWTEFSRAADKDTMVWVLIEDREGVEHIEEIVSVPGVDAVLFGPFDMSQALGHEGDIAHSEVRSLLKRVEQAARSAGVELISLAKWEPGEFEGAKHRGAKIIVEGNDRTILSTGLRRCFKELRDALRPA